MERRVHTFLVTPTSIVDDCYLYQQFFLTLQQKKRKRIFFHESLLEGGMNTTNDDDDQEILEWVFADKQQKLRGPIRNRNLRKQ